MMKILQTAACVMIGLTVAQAAAAGQGGSDLTKLTVPASQLPAGCRLIPGPRGFLTTNPSEVTDPQQLGFVHSLLFGPLPGEPANVGKTPPTSAAASAMADLMTVRGTRVRIGYAAAYEEKDGAHEIGVYALRMKDPAEVKGLRGPSAGRTFTATKGSVVIFSWEDILPGRKGLGCFDVIKRHIESVQLK